MYWPCVGRDANAQPVLSANPVTLKVRWDGSQRTVFTPEGNPIAIDATVVVDRKIPLGSAMWEGSIDDLPGALQMPNQDVYEVVLFNAVPDYKGRNAYMEVNLIRKRDTI